MTGCPPAKKLQMSAQGPLNDEELSMVTGLLHRAVKHGQSFQLYGFFKNALTEKSSKVPAKAFLQDLQRAYDDHRDANAPSGSMTDAAKRRYDAEADGESSASSDWEGLSQISKTSLPLGSSATKKYGHKNKQVPLPPDANFEQWCKSICTLPKVKHFGLTYLEMVEKSGEMSEIHDYLKWVQNTHGASSSSYMKGKRTQVMDLAIFLEAIGWTPQEKEPNEMSFSRVVKK